MGDLVEVHALVDEDQEASVAHFADESRPELEEVVPVIVVDDDGNGHTQLGSSLGLGGVLASEPAQAGRHLQAGDLTVLPVGLVVSGDDPGEVEAAHQKLQLPHGVADLAGHEVVEAGVVGGDAGGHQLVLHHTDPAGDELGERAAVGGGLGGQILHQLPVGSHTRAAASVESPFGGQIRVGGDEIPLQGVAANELDEEALTATVAADEEAHGAAAPVDLLQVGEERGDLVLTADGDVGRSCAGHHARRHGGQERAQHAAGDFYLIQIGIFHIFTPFIGLGKKFRVTVQSGVQILGVTVCLTKQIDSFSLAGAHTGAPLPSIL